MRLRHLALVLAGVAAAAVSAAAAPAPAAALRATLDRVDQAAAGFKGMSAAVRRVYHTAVINEDTVDIGTMYLKRVRANEIRMLVNLTQPDERALAVEGRRAEVYYPKIKTVQEWDIERYRGLLDQFMLLGFGNTSKDLESAYTIRLVGSQTLAGQAATQLELVPKSKQVLQHLIKVELWINDATGYPVQQKFHMPGGDYQLVTYTDTKINPNLPDSALKLQLPKGVKHETPQKQ